MSLRSRIPALLCALAVLICELASYPFATMSICDDGPYILMARTFAETGHIVYNGWAAAMIVSQLYLAGLFINFFGFSYTTARMSTLLLAVLMAYLLQRTLVQAGCSERNATLGTLTAVLSPLYLMLSATFMSDIIGLFAIIICLYGCLRALRASTDKSALGWFCVATVLCAFLGTSRQIAWMGNFVMLPCALWLLRSRRRIVPAAAGVTIVAILSIFACMHWFSHQPYAVPVPLRVKSFPMQEALQQLSYILFEIPFLVLPVIAVFFPEIGKSGRIAFSVYAVLLMLYLVIAYHARGQVSPILAFEPTSGQDGSWVDDFGGYGAVNLHGPSRLVHSSFKVPLTILSIGGLLGVIAVVLRGRKPSFVETVAPEGLSWRSLGILLVPFSLAYLSLLILAVGTTHQIFDRYGIGLYGPLLIVLIRLYQEHVKPDLPFASALLVVLMAAYGICWTHNTFALNRARVKLAQELHESGIPDTSFDGGWEYNFDTELHNATHLNYPLIKFPADAYIPMPPPPPGPCQAYWGYRTPHVKPLYGLSYDPGACYGVAPFAPVEYRAWPRRKPLELYVVRYTQSSSPSSVSGAASGR
jgi:hypothetical protein